VILQELDWFTTYYKFQLIPEKRSVGDAWPLWGLKKESVSIVELQRVVVRLLAAVNVKMYFVKNASK